MNSFVLKLFEGFEWVMRLVRLNLVFLLACVLGLGFISVFPAITASFAVAIQWTKGDTDLSVWKEFWKGFKQYFFRSQLVGYAISLASLIIYVDFQFFNTVDNLIIRTPVIVVLAFLLIALVITGLYIFPTLIQFNLPFKGLVKTAFYSGLSHLHFTLINVIGIAGILVISYRFPGTLLFLTTSSIILWMACMNQIVRNKIVQKYEQNTSVTEKIT